mgnify:CR=1 FL=1
MNLYNLFSLLITRAIKGSLSSLPTYEAHSGASIAQSAIERKQKNKTEASAMYPPPQVETPRGNDGKKYRNFLLKDLSSVLEIKLIKIMIF